MMKINKSMIRLGLTALGVLGIPITSWLSIKCHDKAKDVEDKKEKAKCYIPAMVSGVATAACVIGSHKVSSKEIAALSATASFAIANRDKLEQKIKETIPDQQQAKKEITKSKAIVVSDKPSIESTGRGMLKCLEGYSGRLFYSSIEAVKSAEEKMSRRFNDGQYICLNDFYQLLGITQTHFGHQWGWVPDQDYYPNFDIDDNPLQFENNLVKDDEGNDMLVIEIYNYPMESWMEV